MLSSWFMRFPLSVAAILLVAVVVCADEPSANDLRLPDLDGRQIEPLRAKDAKAIVFIFIRTDCPLSNRYAPEVRRLHDRFAKSGVRFWLVYPDPDESGEIIRKHIKEYEYRLSALRDPQHKLVKITGAQVTPEAAVFLPGGRMVYRGRIDDRYVVLGKARPVPTTRDLEQVLEAILEGKQVTNKTTAAIGCFIPDLR
ncbi:MAG TPA: redoxin domain-containing protein [Blastocatellia bacterium]|nr:redoxin domain-containing protein [Blastocatellia bacterium]